MGGKHKQAAHRTKNNARPSSSGRSAELLGNSINPFVGFSTVKDASSTVPVLSGFAFTSTSNDEIDPNLDPNFQLVLKKMNKKDSTTKLKALQEFTELVKSSQPEAVKAVLAFWVRLYTVLAVDVEHRVREATHHAHRAVVLKVKRNLAPYLKQLAGPWFTSQYDTYPPAASAATLSFEDAFPSNKMQEAIAFCQEEILAYICDNISVQTAQTLSNPKTTSAEEAEAKYERLLIASLQGYTLYLSKLSRQQLEAAHEINSRIISSAKFWKMSKTKVPLIRAAWFGCITALCQNAPFFLSNEVQHVTSAVFCNLDETEPAVLNATWEAALLIISNFEDWSTHVNMEKLVLPKLWKVLKEGGQGSASVVFPNLLLLMSHFPNTVDTNTLYNTFFENMRTGMKKRAVLQSRSEFSAIATSFTECLRYIVMKNVTDISFCNTLITLHLVPTIEWCFTEESVTMKPLFVEVSSLLQYWTKNRETAEFANYKDILECFWKEMKNTFSKTLLSCDQNYEKDQLLSAANKQIEFLMCLKRQGGSKPKKNKVKFVSPERKPESGDSSNDSLDVTLVESSSLDLNHLVYDTCFLYLTYIKDKHRNELISALCLLIQNFDSENLFKHFNSQLGCDGDKNNKLIDIHTKVFLNFLKVHSTCSPSVVDLVFTLYKYLDLEAKNSVLQSLTKLTNEECLCWCVAKALSHPYCEDVSVQAWVTTPHVTKMLVNIASSMLNDELSPDKSLLLKQALNQNANGDFYISKEACTEIMMIFCGALLSPSDYPYTIDTCASFSTQLAEVLYTEKTLLSYGDQLILALFSFSCNTKYDPETVSKDTLWEVGTAWQDVVATLNSDKMSSEFENLMWKFTKIIQNEFVNDSSPTTMKRLANVTVDLIKAVINESIDSASYITKSILSLPPLVRTTKEEMDNVCACAELVTGSLSWLSKCPLPEDILQKETDDINVLKYLAWHRFVISVLNALYKKQSTDFSEEEEEEENEEEAVEEKVEETQESVFAQSSIDVTDFIISALCSYANAKSFIANYTTTHLYNKITAIFKKTTEEYRRFLNDVIPAELLQSLVNTIENVHNKIVYILHNDLLINKCKLSAVYTNLVKKNNENSTNLNTLQLTQLFSKHLTYDHVTETKNKSEKLIVTRALIHCDEIDVPVAEALSAVLAIREKNIATLLYNRDVSTCSWEEIETVVEIIRLLQTIIKQNHSHLSARHWDFVLISLTSWTSSIEMSKQKYQQVAVANFITAVCDFYVAFHRFIRNEKLSSCDSQPYTTLVTEFCDLFAEDVHVSLINTWLYIAEQELESKNTFITRLPVLERIGNILPQLEANYLIKVGGDSRLPKWQTIVQMCGRLLQCQCSVLQLWGYHGLQQILQELVVLDVQSLNQNSPQAYGLMCSQLGHVLTTMQDVVQIMLMDFKLGEDSCRVEPFTDSYRFTLGYLLLWDILLSFCQFASTDLRYQYSDWLRSGEYLKNLLNNIFRLMPTEVLHCAEGKKNSMTELFTNKPSFAFSEPLTSQYLEHVVCWVYVRGVMQLPAVVRGWWGEADTRTAHVVHRVTAAYVTPILCALELQDVADRNSQADQHMKVKVHMTAREVSATYTVDEVRMEVCVSLPGDYPLGPVHVHCSNHAAATQHTRNTLMQLTIFLTHQNGRIWDGLSLWKSSLDKKFDGVEECYICFSVLHNATYQLPKLSCQTCRKKFHSPCLYKWFSTSNKSTCPICRNLF